MPVAIRTPRRRLGPGHRPTSRRARAPPLEDLAALKTPFRPHGQVTAGNAAGLNDGATAALLASEPTAADELGLPVKMRLVGYAFAGVEPEVMGVGPIPSTEKALTQAGLTIDDIGLFEINEAFAVQVLAFLDHFGIADDDPRVNPYGGAIAIGHPLASSGVRLMTQLARQFDERPDVRYGMTDHVHRHRHGRHRHLGEPAPRRRGEPSMSSTHEHHRRRCRDFPDEVVTETKVHYVDLPGGAGTRGADHPRQRPRPQAAQHLRPGRRWRRWTPRSTRCARRATSSSAVGVTGKPFIFGVGADLSVFRQLTVARAGARDRPARPPRLRQARRPRRADVRLHQRRSHGRRPRGRAALHLPHRVGRRRRRSPCPRCSSA